MIMYVWVEVIWNIIMQWLVVVPRLLLQNKQELSVQKVESEKSTDYYLKVKSPGKTLKESSMKEQFEARFETELTKLKEGLLTWR